MAQEPVLVVDLDAILLKTDLLRESFWAAMADSAGSAARMLCGMFNGEPGIRERCAERVTADASLLPYQMQVLNEIRDRRDAGGRIVLVTAAPRRAAENIAAHLGLFDEVLVSDGTWTPTGEGRGRFLANHYGAGNFDYVGASPSDIPVWKQARRAITVGAPASLRSAAETAATEAVHLDGGPTRWGAYVKAIRPHQWIKNSLIFVPAIAAHNSSAGVWLAAGLAFVSFCLVASAVYVLNDLLDLRADRAHPRKRLRPFASGAVPLSHGAMMAFILLIAGFSCSLIIGRPALIGILVGYFALAMAYSLDLKRRPMIDIFILAGLYSIRVLAGGYTTGIPLSVWLLAISIFIFVSLAAVKRQGELTCNASASGGQVSRRPYRVDDLTILAIIGIASGYMSVLVIALYINAPRVQALYTQPQALWAVCPVIMFWISRMVMIAHRGQMNDDPIVFALRDPVSCLCGLLIAGAVVVASVT